MKDDDDRQAKEEEALKQFIDGYSRLVAIMARHVADGTKAEEVTDIVENMKPSMVRGMLLARMGVEAHHAAEQLGDDPLQGMRGNPTLN